MKRKKKNRKKERQEPNWVELNKLLEKEEKRFYEKYPRSTKKFFDVLTQFTMDKFLYGYAVLDLEKLKEAYEETTIEELQQVFTIYKKDSTPVFLGDVEHWELEGNEED